MAVLNQNWQLKRVQQWMYYSDKDGYYSGDTYQ
jgi:hypothetical protein